MTFTPVNLRATFPLPSSPFVDPSSGNINDPWLNYMQAEHARTGGNTGPTTDLGTVAAGFTQGGPPYLFSPSAYCPAGHTLGTDATLGSIFATLPLAQRAFPTAIALTDQIDGECLIAALNAASALPGGKVIQSTALFLSRPVVFEGGLASLEGINSAVANLHCQHVQTSYPGSPAVSVDNCPTGTNPVDKVSFWGFNDAVHGVNIFQAGVAHTEFVAGSIGLAIVALGASGNNALTRLSDVNIYNFDQALSWTNSVYLTSFDTCNISHNNKGLCVSQIYDNFGERMTFRNCIFGNNNWGFYIDAFLTYASPAYEFILDGCSVDYNVFPAYYYGNYSGLSYNDCQNTLILTGGTHFETWGNQSAANPFIQCDGGQVFVDGSVQFYWNGYDGYAVPGYIQFINTGLCTGAASNVVGYLSGLPIFYTTEGSINATGVNCLYEDGSPMIVARYTEQSGLFKDLYSPSFGPIEINGFDFVSNNGAYQNQKFVCIGGSDLLQLTVTSAPVANPGTLHCSSVAGAVVGMSYYPFDPFYNGGTITAFSTISNTLTMSTAIVEALPPVGQTSTTIGFLGGSLATYGSGSPTDPFEIYIGPDAGDTRSGPVNFLLGTTMEFTIWGETWEVTTAASLPSIVTAADIPASGAANGVLHITSATGAQLGQGMRLPGNSNYPSTYIASSVLSGGTYSVGITDPVTLDIPAGTTLACGGPALTFLPKGGRTLYQGGDRIVATKTGTNQWTVSHTNLSPFASPITASYVTNYGVIQPDDLVSRCDITTAPPFGQPSNTVYQLYAPPLDGWQRTIFNDSNYDVGIITNLWGTANATLLLMPQTSQKIAWDATAATWRTVVGSVSPPSGVLGRTSINVAGGANVTLTVPQCQFALLVFTGALTSNVTITLPVGGSAVQIWTVGNQCSGNTALVDGSGNVLIDGSGNIITDGTGFTITLQGVSGGTITLPQGGFQTIWTDGAGIYTANTVASIATGSIAIGTTPGGPSWTTGTAAPTATAPIGSLYSCSNGTLGATLYVSRGGGTWAAVPGV
jgi:hypothetical protein